MDKELKALTARNVSYNTIATVTVSMLQFATSILLARVLLPKDYGIVGFAQILTNFMMQFCDFGINGAIIQKNEVDDLTVNTAFTLKAMLSVFVFAVIVLAAPLSNHFMGQQEIPTVIRVLSCNFLISVFTFLPQTMLTRDLDYKKLVVPQTISVAISSIISITLAYNGFGFWSIVVGSIATNLLNSVMLYAIKPLSFRFAFDKIIAGQLLRFGGSILIPGVIVFIIFNTDNFVIGTLKGAEQLGYYAIAFNWGSMVCVLMAGSFHKVLFPTFSKLQHDIPAMRKAYLTSVRYIAFLVVPVNLLLLLEGREFLFHILGRGTDRWQPALVAFQLLCIYGVFRAVLEPLGNVILGLGKPQLLKKAIYLVALIEIGLLYPAVKFYGIEGVAVAVTIAYISQYLIYLPIMKKEINVLPGDMLKEVRTTIIAAIVMTVLLVCLRYVYSLTFLSMIVNSIIGIVVYCTLFGLLDNFRTYSEFRSLFKIT